MEKFPGHIACDAESASEIVVPIMQGGKVSFFFELLPLTFLINRLRLIKEAEV